MNKLVMPSNATALTMNEMMEVNGGEKYTFNLSNNECKALCFAICGTMAGLSVPAVMATVDVAAITLAAFVPGLAGLSSTVLAGAAWQFAKTMTEVCLSDTKGLKIEYEYPLDLKFTVTGK